MFSRELHELTKHFCVAHAQSLRRKLFARDQLSFGGTKQQILRADLKHITQRSEFVGFGHGDANHPVASGVRRDAFAPIAQVEGICQLGGR